MQCPTCRDYGDLVSVRVKATGQEVIACTECDLLWEGVNFNDISADNATDVTSFLVKQGVFPSWGELEILKRI